MRKKKKFHVWARYWNYTHHCWWFWKTSNVLAGNEVVGQMIWWRADLKGVLTESPPVLITNPKSTSPTQRKDKTNKKIYLQVQIETNTNLESCNTSSKNHNKTKAQIMLGRKVRRQHIYTQSQFDSSSPWVMEAAWLPAVLQPLSCQLLYSSTFLSISASAWDPPLAHKHKGWRHLKGPIYISTSLFHNFNGEKRRSWRPRENSSPVMITVLRCREQSALAIVTWLHSDGVLNVTLLQSTLRRSPTVRTNCVWHTPLIFEGDRRWFFASELISNDAGCSACRKATAEMCQSPSQRSS